MNKSTRNGRLRNKKVENNWENKNKDTQRKREGWTKISEQ